MSASWLETKTEKSNAWWMAQVKRLIGKHSKPVKGSVHDTTDTGAWLAELTKLILRQAPHQSEKPYDENLYAASVLSQVLALWYLRCHRAKSLDPRRPLNLRQQVTKRWLEYASGLLMAVLDDRQDAAFFPGQQWRLPFDPDAESGDFV